jgi:hypothetical protein
VKHTALTTTLLLMALCLISSTASASTWYVNGVSGSDGNNCMSSQTACKTIGHAISLASSGDSIMVAAATYTENLVIGFSLRMIGSGASTTIIDGGQPGTVVAISSSSAVVTLSDLTIRNGFTRISGAGISNSGTLTINNSTITGNLADGGQRGCGAGGGIANGGTVTINNSTITGNGAAGPFHCGTGGGIANAGTATVNNSTLSGNGAGVGGGISNRGHLKINNSTISGNEAAFGGGIANRGPLKISNGTISGNKAVDGGGIFNAGGATLQNSIVANNSGGNCFKNSVTSKAYNLSSDGSCNFNGPGDLNNTNPRLGPLQDNGGPTMTMALPAGSRAIDAGNPSGCKDGLGHLLKTDQRGMPRPDPEDAGGCDMGAYERQSD